MKVGPHEPHEPQLQDTHGRRLLHSSAAELSCSSSAHHCSRALRQSPVAAEQTCGNLEPQGVGLLKPVETCINKHISKGFLKWGYLQINQLLYEWFHYMGFHSNR